MDGVGVSTRRFAAADADSFREPDRSTALVCAGEEPGCCVCLSPRGCAASRRGCAPATGPRADIHPGMKFDRRTFLNRATVGAGLLAASQLRGADNARKVVLPAYDERTPEE